MSMSNKQLAKLQLLQKKYELAETKIEKADLVTTDMKANGGYLQPRQARRFLIEAILESRAMRLATVMPMESHTREIPKLRFGGTVLVGANEGVELAEDERSKPDLNESEIVSELYRAQVRLTDEDLEDSVEGARFQATIRRELARAVSRDVEDAGLNGDVNSTETGKRGKLLRKQDGLLKRAVSHTVDAGGVKISKTLMKRMWKEMPKEWRKEKRRLQFWASSDAETDWRDVVANRGTQLGDLILSQDRRVGWSGVPIEDIPLFPDDLGGGSDQSVMLLLDPKNAHWGFWRNIRIRSEQRIAAGAIDLVVDVRFGVNFAVEDAIVKLENLRTAD